MRYHLKCLFLLTADTSYVQLPHSLVVLDKTRSALLKRERKLTVQHAHRQAHGPKAHLSPQEAASAWTGSDQGNRSLGKAGETPAASMLRQSLSILKQFGSATR